MAVVLIAHSAIETINDPRATSYTSYQLRLHKRARGLVQDWCRRDRLPGAGPARERRRRRFRQEACSCRRRFTALASLGSAADFVAKNRYGLPAKMPVTVEFNYSALASYFPQPSAVSTTATPRNETN